jgi:O-antigen ligase
MFFLFFVSISIITLVRLNQVSDRYSFGELATEFSSVKLSDIQKGKTNVQLTQETSSILTRIKLWSVSIKMIDQNPAFGVGAGRWNKYKNDYGFHKNVLIDSHNDFLSNLSQFGVVTGIFLSYFLFFYPIVLYFKLRRLEKNSQHSISGLAYINIGMFICGFSNSGSYKHQVFSLLIFNSLCLYGYYESKKEGQDAKNKNSLELKKV